MNGKAWSALEDAELRELYPNVKTSVLAKIFGRGVSAIYGRARILGLNWERANGPLPVGHCLWFKDRNRQNCELSNLELITRAEMGRRAPLHAWPKPLKRAIQARGALNRRINRMERTNAAHA